MTGRSFSVEHFLIVLMMKIGMLYSKISLVFFDAHLYSNLLLKTADRDLKDRFLFFVSLQGNLLTMCWLFLKP